MINYFIRRQNCYCLFRDQFIRFLSIQVHLTVKNRHGGLVSYNRTTITRIINCILNFSHTQNTHLIYISLITFLKKTHFVPIDSFSRIFSCANYTNSAYDINQMHLLQIKPDSAGESNQMTSIRNHFKNN